ncbi:hypothetical protein C4579_01805 [Candidatus Microgenomates bacterium]|nr:MAG: hypothetical protein C4579_01805 [Candidatus Microgenomates bacterium]
MQLIETALGQPIKPWIEIPNKSSTDSEIQSFRRGGRLVVTPDMIQERVMLPDINDTLPNKVYLSYLTMTPGRGPGAQAERIYKGLAADLATNNIPVASFEPYSQNNGYYAHLPNVVDRVNMDMNCSTELSDEEKVALAFERVELAFKDALSRDAEAWLAQENSDQPLNITIIDIGYDGMAMAGVKKAVAEIRGDKNIDLRVQVIDVDSGYDSGQIPSGNVINEHPTDLCNPASFDSNESVTSVRIAVDTFAPDVRTYIDSPTANTHSVFAAAGHPIPTEVFDRLLEQRHVIRSDAKMTLQAIYAEQGVDPEILFLITEGYLIDVEMNGQYINNQDHLGRKVQTEDQHQDVQNTSRNLLQSLRSLGSPIRRYNNGQSLKVTIGVDEVDKCTQRLRAASEEHDTNPNIVFTEQQDVGEYPLEKPVVVLVPKQLLEMAQNQGGKLQDNGTVIFSENARVVLVERQNVGPEQMSTLLRASDLVISRTSQMNTTPEAAIVGTPVMVINMPGHNFMWSTSADEQFALANGLGYNVRTKPDTDFPATSEDFTMTMVNILNSEEVAYDIIQIQDEALKKVHGLNSPYNIYNVLRYFLAIGDQTNGIIMIDHDHNHKPVHVTQ